jgi:hypothetical protein
MNDFTPETEDRSSTRRTLVEKVERFVRPLFAAMVRMRPLRQALG